MSIESAAANATAPADGEAVGPAIDLSAESGQAVDDARDPVRLLRAQLLGAADDGLALGKAAEEADERELVDGGRDVFGGDFRSAKRRRSHVEPGDGLRPRLADLLDGHGALTFVRAPHLDPHAREDREQADPGPVDSHLPQADLTARNDQGADQEERRGGEVARDRDVPSLETLGRSDGDRATVAPDLGPGRSEQPLGVITRPERLADGRRTLGEQAGEEQAGLHLSAGDGHLVVDAPERRAADA